MCLVFVWLYTYMLLVCCLIFFFCVAYSKYMHVYLHCVGINPTDLPYTHTPLHVPITCPSPFPSPTCLSYAFVSQITSGWHHIMCVDKEGQVYVWGKASQHGHSQHTDTCSYTPNHIHF